ncbi:hypothetical protein TNCV_555581 [Trichonephila clavipes]|nr:hypothetical protein TNCV_555581 [Trichonephila clavipes]
MGKNMYSLSKCKVHRHTKSKFGEYEVPDTRFSVIHIDLIGPLPPSQGMTFCMTCIDRFSCWMEAVPLPDCKAETASKAFYEHWVCRFGVPGKIVTDQGRQFESQLFRSLAAICGAKVAHATSYHPQCNGKVERLHRTLKGAIKAHNNIKWTETLPTILLGLRTALRPDTNHTIAQMVYGSNIRLPGEFFNPPSIQIDPETFVTTLQTFMDDLKPTKSSPPKNQKIFVHKDLKSCTHVFVRVDRVRKALEPPYDGPFPVKERYEKYFTLTIKNKPVNISVDRLKPAYLLMTDSIPDKTTVPCKQSDDTNLLTDVKPTVSRHGRLVKKPDCLDSEGIQRLVWPARSPDLNPIENVWNALGRQVAGRNYPPTNKNTLIRALTEEWDKLPQQLLDNVVQSMVPQTISRHLAEANLKSKRPFRALPLTPEHRQLRLQWCQARSMWNVTDWQKVVFSDESRFVLGTDDNRVRVWRRPGERYNSPHTVLRHTARTAGVKV